MKILRSLPAIIAALLIAAVPLAAPAQFTLGIGFTVGVPPPAMPYYAQPAAPYPNYQWTPGYWAWGPAGYYWVPGVWVAPPAVGLLWTPGYWGYGGGGYGWNAGYWGASVGFYGGINYGFGYPGTGFYGGGWNGNNFAYNTAVTNVNSTNIHNTYNKTVINNGNVCKDCKNVSYNGGKGGTNAKATQGQIQARQNGRAPTTDQKNQAKFAGQDRNQLASVNKGKPSMTTSKKPFSDTNRPANSKPITAQDKQVAQRDYKPRNANAATPSNKAATENKPANNKMNAANQNKSANNKMNAANQNKPANNKMNAANQNKPAHNNMNAANQNKPAQRNTNANANRSIGQNRQPQRQRQPQQQQQPPRQHSNNGMHNGVQNGNGQTGRYNYQHQGQQGGYGRQHGQGQNMQGQQHYGGQPRQGGGQARPQGNGQGRPPGNGNGQGRPPRG